MRNKYWVWGAILGMGCSMLAAEETVELGEVDIEAKQEVKALMSSPLPVTVIEADKFHGRNVSLNEVIKRAAGVRLAQEGGLGSRSTIAIHGLEGQRVKIFIDGNPLNAPDGTFGINDIPIQLIQRIEIYKGVVPARFGGDALAGAVNVVTRDFDGSWVDGTLSSGSFNTQRFAGVLTKKWYEEGIEIGIGGFYNEADNDYSMMSPYVEGLKIKRDHDQFRSFIFAFAGKVEDRWFDEIGWELIRYESFKELQGIEFNIREAKNESAVNLLALEFEKQDFLLTGLDFDYDFMRPEMTLKFVDKATTCYSFSGKTRACPGLGGEISGLPKDSADKQTEFRHDLNLHYALNATQALNFHFNSLESDYEPRDPLASESLGYQVGAFPSKKTNRITTLSHESSFFDGTLMNDIGAKYYDYEYNISSQIRALAGTPQQTTSAGDKTGFYVSSRYSPLEGLFFKASYEEAYRLPDSTEAFGNGVTITSSPEIQPEEAKNWNVGLLFDRYGFATTSWLKFELTYFNRDIKNLIKLQPSNRTSQYVNLGHIGVEGFEVELKSDLTDQWYVFLNYTYQDLVDEQRFQSGSTAIRNPTYGLKVPNIPSQLANFGFEYKRFGVLQGDDTMLKLFWETHWVDDYFYGWQLSQFQSRKIDSQISHTAGAEYSFRNDELILGFEVRNLTDEDVTDVFNRPLMGRAYFANLRYTWLE